MKEQLSQLAVDTGTGTETGTMQQPCVLWSCQFNSGLFHVDWARSREVLEKSALDVTVVSPE